MKVKRAIIGRNNTFLFSDWLQLTNLLSAFGQEFITLDYLLTLIFTSMCV